MSAQDARGRDDLRAAFEAWVSPHLPAMWMLASRLAGPLGREDAYQEALLTAWRRRDTYDEQRGTARTWLLVLVADRCRKQRRRPGIVSYARHELLEVAEPSGPAKDIEGRLDLARAISELPRRQRMAVELHYLVDLSVADVASVMGCSVGTVTSTLTDARRGLRIRLGERQ